MSSNQNASSSSSSGTLLKASLNAADNPQHAIYLTEADVVKLRTGKINNWPQLSEIWALKYGIPGLALSNVLTNSLVNSLYRTNFLVNSPKYAASWVSSIIVTSLFPPAAAATFLHFTYLERLLKISSASQECPICLEIRGLATHLVLGSLIPFALAWTTSFYHASLYYTIRIPNLDSYIKAGKKRAYFKEISKIFKNTNRNSYGRIITCLSLQTIFACGVFFFQQKQFFEHIEPYEFTANDIKKIKSSKF